MQFIKYDIINGIKRFIKCCIPLILFFVIMCIYFHNKLVSQKEFGALDQAGFLNYIVYWFSGAEAFTENIGKRFMIPYVWLFIQIYSLYLLGSYGFDDIKGMGQQLILRTKDKKKWIIGKIVYVIVDIALMYISIYIITFIYALIMGNVTNFSEIINDYVSGIPMKGFGGGIYFLCSVFVLPFLTSIFFGIAYILLCIYIKPIYAYVLEAVYIIASAYWLSYFLLGNYSMLKRNVGYYSFGINTYLGIGIIVSCIAAIIFAGVGFFNKKDIM